MFTNTERPALAGFLAGYSGLTREAYELDLRQYASWCHQHHLRLFQARRADIECFARDLEAHGRGCQLRPPRPGQPLAELSQKRIKRRPILGGLINEYQRAA